MQPLHRDNRRHLCLLMSIVTLISTAACESAKDSNDSSGSTEAVAHYCEIYDKTEAEMAIVGDDRYSDEDQLAQIDRADDIYREREEAAPKEIKGEYAKLVRFIGLPSMEMERPSEQERVNDADERIKRFTKQKCGFN